MGIQRKRSFNQGNGKKSKNINKKSLQQWLRLQEIHHRIRDCDDDTEKLELYIKLIKVHDETLEQTRGWFDGSSDFVKKGIVDHYGNLPETEAEYWTLPNGPTWLWWVLNTLPIDPPLKLLLLSKTSLKERLENTRRILRFLAKGGKSKSK